MRAMIMSAGLGTRLMPLTGLVPKPMAPVANRPAMEHILRLLRRHGITEVAVNLHHFPEAISDYFGDGSALGVTLHYAYEPELLGTAGGVKNNQDFLGDTTFVVMSGDSLTDVDLTALVAAHHAYGGIATLGVVEVDDPSQYGVVVTRPDGSVAGFQEKPARADAESNLCNCGIYVFESAIFDRIPAATFYDFGKQVLPELVTDGVPFYAHVIDGYWSDVGDLGEYRRGNFDALAGRVRVDMPGREVRPGVWMGEGTTIAASVVIEPPVLLGEGCVVGKGATLVGPLVIGDQTTIAAGAHLHEVITWTGAHVGADSRVRGGIVGHRAHVHADVLLEGTVVGAHAVVGAGSELGAARVEPHAQLAPGSRLAPAEE
jgi:NDP-sugar pyrophosphorylase family protein